jgi:hypothetical protein
MKRSHTVFKMWVAGVAAVALSVPVAAGAQGAGETAQVKSRQSIAMMEGVLERAVSNGAEDLLREIRPLMPEPPMLSGVPEVRGFRLEGYGVFFDVEVPGLRLPITFYLRSVIDDRGTAAEALAGIKTLMERLAPGDRERAEVMVTELEFQLRLAQPGPRRVGTAAADAAAAPQAVSVRPPSRLAEDPNEAYTRAVKAALVDAMLEWGGPLYLADDEWLTVAARDNVPRDPLIPGDAADSSTVVFRIKGADLSAYRERRLTLDEVRAKVEIREY